MADSIRLMIAVDIGTTRTHLAAVDTRELSCADRIDFDNAAFDDRFLPAIKTIAAAHPQIRGINISSCVKSLTARAKSVCGGEELPVGAEAVSVQKNKFPFITYDIDPKSLLNNYAIDRQSILNDYIIKRQSIQIKYDTPQTLGTDRLCNTAAAAALYRGENCVIIDAGTAITVDFLREGKVFEGGAILPGLSMQLSALHAGTDSLPSVRIHDGYSDPVGTSTADCIRSGVVCGAAGAIDRLVGEYKKFAGGDTRVIITGGDSGIISSMTHNQAASIHDLTLIGTGIYSPIAGK